MGNLLQKADKPAISVSRDATIMQAVATMVEHKVGAVVILDDGRALGLFSERDLMAKVVVHRLDPEKTLLATVMTAPVLTVSPETSAADALRLMSEKHIRHLPIADADGKVLGMLSIRHLMQDQIEDLKSSVDSLEAYAAYDGASG